MKIGIDARFWNQTGVGRYTRNLVKNLQDVDKKNKYILFVRKTDKASVLEEIKSQKFKVVVVDINWHSLDEQFRFPQIIAKQKLDLMHFPYFSVPIFYRKPYIITIHDLILHHFSTGQATTLPLPLYKTKKLAYKIVIRNAAKKALAILVPSEATKKEVVDHLDIEEGKVYVTHEGSEIKASNKENKIDINNKYFLYVGNAYPHKNLDGLVNAFREIRREHKDIYLYMVGGEDFFYQRIKEKIRKMELTDSVKFTGSISDNELEDLYKNALALVMPSFMEGFGLPALEAITNKCLVIASKIPAIYEICEDNAVYFDPFDTRDMREKMKYVYKKGRRHFLGKIDSAYKRSTKLNNTRSLSE